MRSTVRALAAAAGLVALAALPAEGQWTVESRSGKTTAVATGSNGQVEIGVACEGSDHALVLMFSTPARSGDVEVQWDDGSTDQYALQHQSATLTGTADSAQVRTFIEKLRRRSTARVRAETQNGRVTDLVGLAGSSRAIGSLPCSSSARVAAGPTDAEIRQILVRQSVARYSGSCACPYNTDRGGRRCGRRSAYSRPGGASPLCYPSDVTDAAVAAYRSRR